MAKQVSFDSIKSFGVDLPRELALFESKIATKFRQDDQLEFGPVLVTALLTTTTVTNAQPWQVLMCDPTAGAQRVILPAPSGTTKNVWIAVKNDSASANTITIVPLTGTIDGVASFTLIGARAFQWFFCDGTEWKLGPSYGISDITIGPLLVTTSQVAYNPTGWATARYVLVQPSGGNVYLRSLTAVTSGVMRKTIINVATDDSDLYLQNDSYSDSVAANRIKCRKANDVYVLNSDAVDIWYDVTISRWRVV